MSSPAFIASGDQHLTDRIWRGLSIRGDACHAFDSLMDLALEWFVPLVLLGDLFDSIEPGTEMVRYFRSQMDRAQAEGLAVYAIQGNHDRRAIPWYCAVHDWPVHIGDGRPVDIGGVRCCGLDYAVRDEIQSNLEQLAEAEPPQVLFLHQAVRQALKWEGQWNCDLDWVPTGVPLTLMGDIHRLWSHQIREGQVAAYTGSTHLRSLAERGPKFCTLVNQDLTTEQLPLPYRPVERFDLTDVQQLQAVRDWLDQQLSTQPELPPVAFCYHTPVCMTEVGRLRRDFDGRAWVVAEGVAEPEELDFDRMIEDQLQDEQLPAGDEDELISIDQVLSRLVDPDREADTYHMVLALLDERTSVQDTIRDRRTEFFDPQSAEED